MSDESWKKKSWDPTQLKLSILQHKLWLVSIKKDQIHNYTKIILQLIFFSEEKTDHFFSYTETDHEISILVDKNGLDLLQQESSTDLILSAHCWKAVQVLEGANLLNETGLIASLAFPLAEAFIEMIYLSTFESDLICVHEDKIDIAFEKLEKLVQQKIENTVTRQNNEIKLNEEEMEITKEDTKLCLIKFEKNQLEVFTHKLLKRLLFPREENRFFSFSNSPKEISLIMNQEAVDEFPDCQTSSNWSIITVHETIGYAVGVLSRTLAAKNIPIYYLSTFQADLILVPSEKLNEANDILQKEIANK